MKRKFENKFSNTVLCRSGTTPTAGISAEERNSKLMNIFKLEFKSTFKSLILWSCIVAFILVLFMAFYPSMSGDEMKDLINTKMSAIPESILKAMGIADIPDFTDMMQYYAYVLQYVVLAGAIYASILGANTLIKEETDGTIEYLYAQPVTRIQITLYKLLSSISSFFIFIAAIAVVSSVIFLMFKPENTDFIKIITDTKIILSGVMFSGLIFLSIGFLISTVIKSAKQATPISIGIVFGTYILGMFSKTVSDKVALADNLKYLSPIDYGMPLDMLKNGFDTINIVLGILIIVVCISFSFVLYNKKDLKI
ncbi:MAG TPA: ABC transporter permease [Clostridiales bacterium]|nr:ABC transporter permease [Clostridiales bacterium]